MSLNHLCGINLTKVCNYNNILKNNISENNIGITIFNECFNNTIFENKVENNNKSGIVVIKKILISNYKLKMNKFQFKYFITKFGKNVFKTFRDCDYKVRNINSTKTGKKFKNKLGKNQKEILIILEKSGSLFMIEIYSELNYLNKNIDTLRDSLLRL